MRSKKQKLRSQADKLFFQRCIEKTPFCIICGKLAQQVHHFFPKGSFGYLRYNLNNGVSLCMGCHFILHHKDPTLSVRIVEKKGKRWYNKLKSQADEKHYSFQTIKWYQDNLEKLK